MASVLSAILAAWCHEYHLSYKNLPSPVSKKPQTMMTLPELCDDNDACRNVVCVMSDERLVSAPRRNLDSWVWSTRKISVWVVPDWYWVKRHWYVLLLTWTIAYSICWRATRTSNLVDVFTSLLELPVPGHMRYYSLGFRFWIMPMYMAKFLCVPDGTVLWGMHFF